MNRKFILVEKRESNLQSSVTRLNELLKFQLCPISVVISFVNFQKWSLPNSKSLLIASSSGYFFDSIFVFVFIFDLTWLVLFPAQNFFLDFFCYFDIVGPNCEVLFVRIEIIRTKSRNFAKIFWLDTKRRKRKENRLVSQKITIVF